MIAKKYKCEYCALPFTEARSVLIHQGEHINSGKKFSVSCPILNDKKRRIRDTPDLVKDLDPSKNKDIIWRGKPIDVLDLSANTTISIGWKCHICNHTWPATGINRNYHGSGCPACANRAINNYDGRNSMANTHPILGIELQGDATKIIAGTHAILSWKCHICNEKWSASGHSRITNSGKGNGTGCSGCAEYGFDQSKPAWVYQIRFETRDHGIFYKCGITNNEVRPRFVKIVKSYKENYDDLIDVKVIDKIYFESGSDAWNFELKLKASDYKLENFFSENFDGYTETFTPNILQFWDQLADEVEDRRV
jgi:hypothetical protein